MEAPHKDSAAFDSILKSKLADTPFDAARDCPDASLIAAFYDGTLAPLERARMQGHLDACARCQATLAAIARVDDADDRALAPNRGFEWRRLLGFGLPVAAAAAIALVIVVRSRNISQPSPNELAMNTTAAQAVQAPQQAAMPAAPGAGAAEAPEPQRAVLARAESANAGAAAYSNSPPPPSPPAAAPPASAGASGSAMSGATLGGIVRRREFTALAASKAAAPAPLMLAEEAVPGMQDTARRPPNTPFTVESLDHLATWVIGPGGSIVKHTQGGRTFTQTSGVNVELLAASAPSSKDCWIVGRKGTVLRTRDGGRYWENVMSPTTEDIVHVRAADSHNAVIRARDGKSYATTDGGATWNMQ